MTRPCLCVLLLLYFFDVLFFNLELHLYIRWFTEAPCGTWFLKLLIKQPMFLNLIQVLLDIDLHILLLPSHLDQVYACEHLLQLLLVVWLESLMPAQHLTQRVLRRLLCQSRQVSVIPCALIWIADIIILQRTNTDRLCLKFQIIWIIDLLITLIMNLFQNLLFN